MYMGMNFLYLCIAATISRVVGELILDEVRYWKARRQLHRVLQATLATTAATPDTSPYASNQDAN